MSFLTKKVPIKIFPENVGRLLNVSNVLLTLVAVSVMLTICELSTALSSDQSMRARWCPNWRPRLLGGQAAIFDSKLSESMRCISSELKVSLDAKFLASALLYNLELDDTQFKLYTT
jgi:hypothetical protein